MREKKNYRKYAVRLFVLTLILHFSHFAKAERGADGDASTRVSTTPSVAESSKGSSKQEGSAKVANIAGGVLLVGLGSQEVSRENYPAAAVYYGMAGLAFYQAVLMAKEEKAAKGTYGAVNYKGSEDVGDDSKDPLSVLSPADSKNVKAKLKQATDKGFKIDMAKGEITTPDGKTYHSKDMASADAMRKAGMSPDQIMKAQKAAEMANKEAEKQAALAKYSFGEEDGGGGGVPRGKTQESPDSYGMPKGAGHSGAQGRGPAQIAGMSRNFNGEPIGVAADSLFEMVARRYKLKDKQDFFLKDMR